MFVCTSMDVCACVCGIRPETKIQSGVKDVCACVCFMSLGKTSRKSVGCVCVCVLATGIQSSLIMNTLICNSREKGQTFMY